MRGTEKARERERARWALTIVGVLGKKKRSNNHMVAYKRERRRYERSKTVLGVLGKMKRRRKIIWLRKSVKERNIESEGEREGERARWALKIVLGVLGKKK